MIRKSLLYRSEVEYGGWTVNHVLGCSHGCLYPCYAMALARRTGRIKNREEWLRPQPVDNAVELLERELARFGDKIDSVHLCFTTDPFMYDAERCGPVGQVQEITLALIQALNARGIPVTTLTKGVYPVELLRPSLASNQFGVSIVSLDEGFRKRWEPGASPIEERIRSLEELSREGFLTWASVEPYPTPNVDPTAASIRPLLERLHFVDRLVFGRWNYNSVISRWPGMTSHYERAAADVLEWAALTGKRVHIKHGTPRPHCAEAPAGGGLAAAQILLVTA